MMLAHNTKMQVCPKDKPALISYEIVRQYPGFTFVRLRQGSVPIIIFLFSYSKTSSVYGLIVT